MTPLWWMPNHCVGYADSNGGTAGAATRATSIDRDRGILDRHGRVVHVHAEGSTSGLSPDTGTASFTARAAVTTATALPR